MKRALLIPCVSMVVVLTWALTLAASDTIPPEEKPVPELKAYRINPHPPTIDGDLNDAIWSSTKLHRSDQFTQLEPDEGKAPSESTVVAVAYDDDALYVAFWCYDSEPELIERQLVRRDRYSESDKVTVCLDPFHDHQTAVRFEVNAAGVQRDTRYYNDDWSDVSWDGVWASGVKRQPWGWSAEMRIPYHCLRFNQQEEQTWGANFTRSINRKGEYVKWAFSPSAEGGFVSKFGHLTDLTGIEPAGHIEVLPYVVSKAETEPKHIGNPDGRDLLSNGGFDLKYSLAPNIILDATINPDFGQVELDQPVLNLSTYETWFPERRPFFLEGADLFETDFSLFYSRRIGRAPRYGVNDDEYAYRKDRPSATTILGAAKLTGKLASGTSIAFLSALTQEESEEYAAETNVVLDSNWVDGELETSVHSADTVVREAVVEPTANYSVVRIKQDLFKKSSVGAMMTLATQDGVHPAMTGGVDYRLFTNNNAWGVDGQVIFSRVDNENTGYGVNATFRKNSGKHVRGAIGATIKSPELSINRLGFTSRVNTRHVWGWMQYRTSDDWWIVRNSWNNVNAWSSWNFDGVNYELGGNFNNYVEFTNFWSFGCGFSIQAEKYSDDETRGNGLWVWAEYPTYAAWLDLTSDQRKKVSFDINPSFGTDRGGDWWSQYLGIAYRPASNMEFEIGGSFSRYLDNTRWVENIGDDADTSVFAELDRDGLSLHGSAGVVLNRNLSLQFSAQGSVYGLDYRNYRYYQGDNNYSDPVDGFNHDYNWSALNTMFLLRWEYRPGSTLYLVWTRSHGEFDDTVNDLNLSRDLKRLFRGDSDNVFLVKASYWLNI